MKYKVLLIEDDPFVVRSIQQVLPEKYQLDVRKDLQTSYTYLAEERPSLVVLDRRLPDGDGIELAEYLSQEERASPILILSGKSLTQDRIEGLRKGADDYLIKPFSTTEFILRLEKLIYSTKQTHDDILSIGPLTLLLDRGHVLMDSHLLRLRRREFQILHVLIQQKHQVLSREQLINSIWPDGNLPSFATIDVYIRRLRMMLGKVGKTIVTVKGFGYQFNPEALFITASLAE